MNKPESWEVAFRQLFSAQYRGNHYGKDSDEIVVFIHSLLKQQAEKYYYYIENSISTAEAEYIEKMVNQKPITENK